MFIFCVVASYLFSLCFADSNPFTGKTLYVNPGFQEELQDSIRSSTGKTRDNLLRIYNISSAFWIDTISKISAVPLSLQYILKDAASFDPPHLITIIVYDLPNRDCHARASNGEICCVSNADGTCNYNSGSGKCEKGLARYKSQYIDAIVDMLSSYSEVPVVAVIEPDSLPNLATNQGDSRCGNSATTNAYTQGIEYAVNSLSRLENVKIYLDAAHGGWLGWQNGLQSFVNVVKNLNVLNKVRGFATNVANYQPLGTQCPSETWCQDSNHKNDPCCLDPCKLISQYNFANNEYNYAMILKNAFMSAVPGFEPFMITDTGRNGVSNMRQDCANWCNIRGAGIGRFPTSNTDNSSLLDAYLWLKTPGESDGCTQLLPNGTQCKRFDSSCASDDSIGSRSGEPRAPTAGQWFDYQVKQLALNMIN